MSKTHFSPAADNTGITSAVLCTIHCLVVPLLFLLKFWWGNNEAITLPSWWGKLDILFLGISFWAVYHSATHTPVKKIKALLWFFWCLLATGIVFEDQLHWLAYIASAGLVGTHIVNIRRIKQAMANRPIQAQ